MGQNEIIEIFNQYLKNKDFQVFLEKLDKSKEKNNEKIDFINNIIQRVLKENPNNAIKLNDYALKLEPNHSTTNLFKAFIYFQFNNLDIVLETLESILENKKANISDLINASNMLIRLNHFEKVDKTLNRYFNEAKKDFLLIEPLMYMSLKLAKWDFVEELIEIIENKYKQGDFTTIKESPRTHLLWCENEYFNNEIVKNWSLKNFPIINHKKLSVKPLQNRKIKLAYLSSDFKEHPTTYLINGLIKNHNKNIFELYMFDSNNENNSESKKEICSYFDFVYNIFDKNDQQVSTLIKNLEIDILIDLNGPTKDNRLGILVKRCAPIQISYLGYPGSVAGRFVDYVIGDNYTVPDDLITNYSEKVIKIQDTYQINDYLSKPKLQKVSKKDYGFKNNQLILGVFNSSNKIRKELWSVWMNILKEVKNSIIWIVNPGEVALKNILSETKNMGVDSKRIVVADNLIQDEHLKRIQICDLMLDTWPYSGHTSTADALFAKVPVITKEGKNFTCRVSGSLLKAANLDEMICKDLEEYENKAISLLKNKSKLKSLKKDIEENVMNTDVFNSKSKTIQIEKAYLTVLEREMLNLPKVHINMKKPLDRPLFSIITTCKNRLEHLKQTLPLICKQKFCEIILVDYDCPEKCGEWAIKNYPQVKVIKVDNKKYFCKSDAQNIGGFNALGKYLMFVDADVLLKENFFEWILKNCKEDFFYQVEGYKDTSLAGTVIMSKESFLKVEGYDEVFVGWGGEDDDMYARLELNSIKRLLFPNNYIESIPHGDEIRQFEDNKDLPKDKLEAHKITSMYCRIKVDLISLYRESNLHIDIRKKLMSDVKKEIKKLSKGSEEARIEITYPPQGLYNLNRTLVYTMR